MTPADIAAAETILGVTFTIDERALMLDNLEAQIIRARVRRGVDLGDAPPASTFDPRLPGFVMPQGTGMLRLLPVDAPLPDDDDDIAFAPVTHLAHWIRQGALTSARLVEIYLARIARLNPTLNAWATVTPDIARAEAEVVDALTREGVSLGPLHGVPYGLKDLFDTKGVTTGWGAEPYADRVPDTDATIVGKLRRAGAVLLGKTTLGALAYGDLWYGGRTRNPWNPEEGSSGSSAGSASATAAGLCAFAIGTETLGSIVSPSQRCGTTGLRPTFGRVSRAGAMPLAWSLDKVGPICRTVADTGLVLSVLNGGDTADRGSIAAPFHWDASKPLAGLRLGYLPEAFGGGATDLDRTALNTAKSLGLETVELTLPDLPYESLTNVLFAEAAAAFENLTLSGRDDELTWQDAPAWPNAFRKARFLSAVDHVQLDRLRYRVMQAVDALFRDCDVVIGPMGTANMLTATNFTGHPCLHLRSGFDRLATRPPGALGSSAGPARPTDGTLHRVPHGISLWGGLFNEGPMLSVGQALEAAFDVHHIRPEI
ncbi:amidase [Jannaschia pohangensis]|uniref:Asp-tRNAAsn/Glu-tRNAGln amidotransferase A subunit n=1 Tax=Jannaschia pohangensis TaxID=390807 RepID=A0A1I3T9C5_9RHOB|nr:amidase [Jannaschia pohangensis]SFJ67684.1 Asp-tRNAAsn/Glu-tRNAGln amidotransferase A subunit [Jannaschia pohangensis]